MASRGRCGACFRAMQLVNYDFGTYVSVVAASYIHDLRRRRKVEAVRARPMGVARRGMYGCGRSRA